MRFVDFTLSLMAILVLFPLLAPIMVVLSLTGEKEIFYTQKRVGYRRRTFKLLKFATMLKDSPNMGAGTITVSGDSRILPFGKVLRATKINELPQLFNILFGQMSLVGPRPMTEQNFMMYDSAVQKVVASVPPGLTGIGSLVFRNEEALLTENRVKSGFVKAVLMPYKGALECWYQRERSMLLNIKIITVTAWVVLFTDTKLIWTLFKDLPSPPESIAEELGYLSSQGSK